VVRQVAVGAMLLRALAAGGAGVAPGAVLERTIDRPATVFTLSNLVRLAIVTVVLVTVGAGLIVVDRRRAHRSRFARGRRRWMR
jgi:hypothetical protein